VVEFQRATKNIGKEAELLSVAPSSVFHNIQPEQVLFCYREGDAESLDVAEYYQKARGIPEFNLCPLPCDDHTKILSEVEFETQIQNPILMHTSVGYRLGLLSPYLASSNVADIWVIILGYNIPHIYMADTRDEYSSGQYIAVASRLHRLGKFDGVTDEYDEYGQEFYILKRPNHTYNRITYKFFNALDNEELYITAVIDGPTPEAAKKIIDRSVAVNNDVYVTGNISLDPYGNQITQKQIDYEQEILDFKNLDTPYFGLSVESTVDTNDPYREAQIHQLENESFYWGWFTPRTSKDLFTDQSEKRVFGYNADDDAAAKIYTIPEESDRWCNLFINIEPGYTSCAGTVDAPGEDAYLRPRPFFHSLHQGAGLGEAYLASCRFVNWKLFLIGDPLMVVKFPLDIVFPGLPNNETIRRIKNKLEAALFWLNVQSELTKNMTDRIVDSEDITEEVYLLHEIAALKTAKNIKSQKKLLANSAEVLLRHIVKTENVDLSGWLERQEERTTQLLAELSKEVGNSTVNSSLIYPSGSWNIEFNYTHERLTLEDIHFILEVSQDIDFNTILFSISTFDSVDGWSYEKEQYTFFQLPVTGFPSNYGHNGVRRIKFLSPARYFLDNTIGHFVRFKAFDSNGNQIPQP